MKRKKVFTINDVLSDFEIFRGVHSQLMDWFVEFDREYFSEYFSDKYDWVDIRIPPDETDFWEESGSNAYCMCESGLIAFEPSFITYALEDDIKYTLLHEMIHLFIAYIYPNGLRHTDSSKVFEEWSMLLRCPMRGPYEMNVMKISAICVMCGCTVHRKYRPRVYNS